MGSFMWNAIPVFFGGLLTNDRPELNRPPSQLCNVCRRIFNRGLPQQEHARFPIQTTESWLKSCQDGCMICIMIYKACKRNPYFPEVTEGRDLRRTISQGASRWEYKMMFWWMGHHLSYPFPALFLSHISCKPVNPLCMAHANTDSANKFQFRHD